MTSTQSTVIINQPAGSSVGIQQQQSLAFSTASAFPALQAAAPPGYQYMHRNTLGNARELPAGHLQHFYQFLVGSRDLHQVDA